ncbi:Zinc transporter, ZIP family [hydrothermal vent metagenome]|uniref:Zinc transporter, ZIP family n=1 Tax=hydrothermal vent metagenome TaxID=652676 RepID=A0A3B0YNG6_9ZZZZ
MTLLQWILVFTLLGGVLSVLAAALFLLLPEKTRSRLLPHAVSFAIGALLGAALLGLLPHALESVQDGNFHKITAAVLFGLFGFFVLEKLVLWRHCHHEECEVHQPDSHNHIHPAAGTLILIGDGLHNFIDGILIGAAFLTDIHLGVVTALAVAAHEIPQEVGDFAVLLHSGFSTSRAFLFNLLSSLTTIIGGVLAYYSLNTLQPLLPYVLAVAASSFIYVAVADLIPGLHKRAEFSATVKQMLLIGAGVGVIYLAHSTLHN